MTTTLVGFSAVLFVLLHLLTPAQQEQAMRFAGFVPWSITPVSVLIAMFVHDAWPPLVANLLYLWIFGANLEDRLGRGRFLAFYLVTGITAAVAQTRLDPAAAGPLLGASGAVAGVLGGYLVLYPTSRVLMLVPLPVLLFEIPAFFLMGIWFVVQFALSVQAALVSSDTVPVGAGFWAQVAAFACGAALALLLQRPERARVEWWSP